MKKFVTATKFVAAWIKKLKLESRSAHFEIPLSPIGAGTIAHPKTRNIRSSHIRLIVLLLSLLFIWGRLFVD